MRHSLPLACSAALLAACADVTTPSLAAVERLDASPAAATTTIVSTFIARAECTADIGFDIWFGGTREMRESTSPAGITRSFVVNDFRGWLTPVTTTTYLATAPSFTVAGGAEMFVLQDGVTRIHEGTLVFVAMDGSYRVVARHVIRNLPGQASSSGHWDCRIVGGQGPG